MEKRIAYLTIVVVIALTSNTFAAAYSGSGTEESPYLIYDANDLLALGADPNYYSAHFKLMADIDLAGLTFTTAIIAPDTDNSSWGFQGTPFTGVFDGNDYKITNLTINTNGVADDYIGLFGMIDANSRIINLAYKM